jgi:uncharacterized membrane protein (DUF485 family)
MKIHLSEYFSRFPEHTPHRQSLKVMLETVWFLTVTIFSTFVLLVVYLLDVFPASPIPRWTECVLAATPIALTVVSHVSFIIAYVNGGLNARNTFIMTVLYAAIALAHIQKFVRKVRRDKKVILAELVQHRLFFLVSWTSCCVLCCPVLCYAVACVP